MPTRTLPSLLHSVLRNLSLFTEDVKLTLFFNKKPDVLYTHENERFKKGLGHTVPVIMCTWRRVDRLEATIAQLVNQKKCTAALYIWNNNKSAAHTIDTIIDTHSELPIKAHHSKRNLGSFARFYIARTIAKKYPYVIIIDDDEYFGPHTLNTFLSEFQKQTIHAFWSFRLTSKTNYWQRQALQPGDKAKYCGVGGSIIDSSVFLDEDLFKCPKRFWFMDDFWLSYYVDHVKKWGLFKSGVKIEFWEDEHDMSKEMQHRKNRFLRYLINKKNWDIST